MINLEALKNAKGTKCELLKDEDGVKLWKATESNGNIYYAITFDKTDDLSITIIEYDYKQALKEYAKAKRRVKQ